MFTQEPMVYYLFRLSPVKEMVTLAKIKVGRALMFCFFFFLFCFFVLFLVNFYSLGPREDTANPESEFGIFSSL